MAQIPCANCNVRFAPRQVGQAFCKPRCKTAWYNRQGARGKQIVPLLMLWRGKRSTPEGARAFTEACRLLSAYADDDRKTQRPPVSRFVLRQYQLNLRP